MLFNTLTNLRGISIYLFVVLNFGVSESKIECKNCDLNRTYHARISNLLEEPLQYQFIDLQHVVRVRTSSENAKPDEPLHVVVKERKVVRFWNVPQVFDDDYVSNVVGPIICPRYDLNTTSTNNLSYSLFVELSTFSKEDIDVTLEVEKVMGFYIGIDDPRYNVTVSPSEPAIYAFTFPENVSAIAIYVNSKDSICAMISIQDVRCPANTLDITSASLGIRQTITTSGVVTMRNTKYNKLHIVVFVKPDDTDCLRGKQRSTHEPEFAGNDSQIRTKTFDIMIGDVTGENFWGYITTLIAVVVIALIIAISVKCSMDVTIHNNNILTKDTSKKENKSLTIETNGTTTNSDQLDAENGEIIQIIENKYKEENKVYKMDYVERTLFGYAWNVFSHGMFYILPVGQFVWLHQSWFLDRGNQDLCYYNFLCIRPLWKFYNFNAILSNVFYIEFGLGFMCLVYYKNRHCLRLNLSYKKKCGFSVHAGTYYAVGYAIIMEGLLSACYHVCPNSNNFQFDAAFMCIISLLGMVLIYQRRKPQYTADAPKTFFIASIILFIIVFGILLEDSRYFWMVFPAFLISFVLVYTFYFYLTQFWKIDISRLRKKVKENWDKSKSGEPNKSRRIIKFLKPENKCRFAFVIMFNVAIIVITSCWVVARPDDVATFILIICTSSFMAYLIYYAAMKAQKGEEVISRTRWKLLVIFLIVMIAWSTSFYFFFASKTNWMLSPAESRIANAPCIIASYYDTHDLWHFLSACGMFFGFLVLLILDDDLLAQTPESSPNQVASPNCAGPSATS